MDNFEQQFLEELAKARARLEGEEAYDDESIEKEFAPDIDLKEQKIHRSARENAVTVQKSKDEVKEEHIITDEIDPIPEKRNPDVERITLVWGFITVAVSLIVGSAALLIRDTSYVLQAISSYAPFIGIILGASSVTCGAVLIKCNKKGGYEILLGLAAILVSVILSFF